MTSVVVYSHLVREKDAEGNSVLAQWDLVDDEPERPKEEKVQIPYPFSPFLLVGKPRWTRREVKE